MSKLHDFVEVFMSLIKWFLVVLLINNAIWLGVVYSIMSVGSAEITQSQDGTNNIQEMTNG